MTDSPQFPRDALPTMIVASFGQIPPQTGHDHDLLPGKAGRN
jgi:hypothetical protein